jgi:hypothetical protein
MHRPEKVRGTVIVAGALANKPFNGGEAWVRLSYILGFKRLGFRVCFIEEIDRHACHDETGAVVAFEDSSNLEYFKRVVERFGLEGSAALVYEGGERTYGLSLAELEDIAETAELLVNISGHLKLEPLLERLRKKAYIDIDPGFTQFWHADESVAFRLEDHDYYFTIGENIGTPACPIPTGGIHWRHTRPPVVLEDWPVSKEGTQDHFTTIANWRGPFGPVHYGGKTFGLKLHEFRKFIDLPKRAPGTFELALNIHPAEVDDIDLLRRHGWRLVDPRVVAASPETFRRYVQTSGAEFSVAQGIYVATHSGWFSDRTVRYLASGKPVLVQDTGFARNLPVGEGLVAFGTLDEAVAGAERIARDYDGHCQAARALAEAYFDSDRVLGRLIEDVEVRP